jgi:hypothetical protein
MGWQAAVGVSGLRTMVCEDKDLIGGRVGGGRLELCIFVQGVGLVARMFSDLLLNLLLNLIEVCSMDEE